MIQQEGSRYQESSDIRTSREAVLEQVLSSAGVDTSKWGVDGYRSLSSLCEELIEGVSSFRLVRECQVICLDVRYQHPERGEIRLFEARQDFFKRKMSAEEREASGDYEIDRSRYRASDFAVWEKYSAGSEDVARAKGRALEEELGLSGSFHFSDGHFAEQWEQPQDYPLVDTLLLAHEDTVWLTKEQFEQCCLVEMQSEKQTIFEWHPAGTDPARLRPQNIEEPAVESPEAQPEAGLDAGLGVSDGLDLFEELQIRDLAGALVSRAVPVDTQWGRGAAKTVAHLFDELELGESTLPLTRYCNAVRIEVVAEIDGEQRTLKEVEREHFNAASGEGAQHISVRPETKFAVWKRLPSGRDPFEVALEALVEELGVSGEITVQDCGSFDIHESDFEYPNLPSRVRGRQFRAELSTEQVQSSYSYQESERKTLFAWE